LDRILLIYVRLCALLVSSETKLAIVHVYQYAQTLTLSLGFLKMMKEFV
jgi:hypothetical protein